MESLEMFLKALAHVIGRKESFFQFYTATTVNPKFPVFKTCSLTLMCVDGEYRHCISAIQQTVNTSEKTVEDTYKELQLLIMEETLKYYNIS